MRLYSVGPLLWLQARKWIFMFFCLVTAVTGHAAVNEDVPLTASNVFADAPLDVLDMLRPSTRLDMLDYYAQADSILPAVNALGEVSRLEQVTPDYLKVSVTPVSTLEIKILDAGKRQIVMTLFTAGADGMAKDTEIRFFDSQLRPLDASKYIKTPRLGDFFNIKGSGISEAELIEKIPFAAVEYSIGPGETPLTATLTTLEVISQEDRDLLTPLFDQPLTSTWKGSFRFR
ncbi:MAG: DUF3256 family protein [Muribaculaceae bacterium]|nr:DUF3256 family protein [Muribaculaceae bacterium]